MKLANAKLELSSFLSLRYAQTMYGERWTTPLHMAAWNKNLELVENLLILGADPRCVDGWGRMPLAVSNGAVERTLKANMAVGDVKRGKVQHWLQIDLPGLCTVDHVLVKWGLSLALSLRA